MKKKIVYERQNEVFHLKLYDDDTVDLVDVKDQETINVAADKLPAVKALIDDMEKYRKGGKL